MPTTITLSSLGSAGFFIQGDVTGDHAGWSVASVGDINGDGYDDFIIGAPTAGGGAGGVAATGEVFIIYGHAGGFSNIDLSSFDPSLGFLIKGLSQDRAGYSVAAAGDFNGDGIDDIVFGAPGQGISGGASQDAGDTYVIFGRTGGFGTIDLSNLSASDGFVIHGDVSQDRAGHSVSSAGDINGDGFDDLIVGASHGRDGGTYSGSAYVIFGHAGAPVTINLASLAPSNGFVIRGDVPGDEAGFSVHSAGDLNGDGFDDVVVGAPYADNGGTSAGTAYVIFGQSGSFGPADFRGRSVLDLTGFASSSGFLLHGVDAFDQAGFAVAGAGDVNGDGFDDVVIGARGAGTNVPPQSAFGNGEVGESYVIFGKGGSFANLDAAHLAPSDGFVIIGDREYDRIGWSVASAGDVNGDGFDDLLLGGPDHSKVYVVYGHAGGFGMLDANGRAVIDLTNLGLDEGFLAQGSGNENAGLSVAAGDINGDGFSDVIIGAPYGSSGGNVSGQAYVIFGIAPTDAVSRVGTDAGQTLAGGGGDDVLEGRGGNDILFGNAGSDSLYGGAGDDVMRGGTGNDYYVVDSAADKVIEKAGEGNDFVFATTSYSLAAGSEVENLGAYVPSGTEAINLAGNEFDNRIVGNDGDNVLEGRDGNDIIYGGAGSNSIYGGAGADTMIGNAGNDYYVVDNAADKVVEAVGEGNDYVFATTSYALAAGSEVENLGTYQPSGTTAIDLTGNELANLIDGNAGTNTLDGAAGADTLYGEGGNDYYIVDNAGDKAIETVGGGYDIVFAKTSYTLTAGSEIKSLGALNQAGTEAINLTGNEFANRIVGNEGANVIDGGAGSDELYGQGGADTFLFSTALGTSNVDRLADFVSGTDKIALDHAVFTALNPGALSASAFANGTAGDADDRIIYDAPTGRIFYDADGTGPAGATLFATVSPDIHLTASDFQVI